MATDHEYDELRLVLQDRLGAGPAATLMGMLPPAGEEPLRRRDLDLLGRELRVEMAAIRADYAALLPKLIAANIASMIGVAGLVLAAASLH